MGRYLPLGCWLQYVGVILFPCMLHGRWPSSNLLIHPYPNSICSTSPEDWAYGLMQRLSLLPFSCSYSLQHQNLYSWKKDEIAYELCAFLGSVNFQTQPICWAIYTSDDGSLSGEWSSLSLRPWVIQLVHRRWFPLRKWEASSLKLTRLANPICIISTTKLTGRKEFEACFLKG